MNNIIRIIQTVYQKLKKIEADKKSFALYFYIPYIQRGDVTEYEWQFIGATDDIEWLRDVAKQAGQKFDWEIRSADDTRVDYGTHD